MTASRVADNLAEAGPRDLVYVDRKGRVRTRARTRALTVAYWGALGALVAAEGYLGYEVFGWPGLSIATVLGGYVGWIFTRVGLLRRGLRQMMDGDLEGAEGVFERVAKARLSPKHLRARAWGGLASAARLRGDDELALARVREAIRLSTRRRSKRAVAQTARHLEAQLLARLGQAGEARAVWRELPSEVPEGEYTRLSYHTTELYLAFCEGRHDLSDDALHERASFALSITAAAPLLALLAWAFEQSDDAEMSELLRDEAKDRHPGELLSVPMPDLDRWLDGRARLRVDADVDDVAEAEAEVERRRADRLSR